MDSIASDVHDKLTSTCLNSIADKLIKLKVALKNNPEVKLELNLTEEVDRYKEAINGRS